jgi:hypothetical protein
MVKKIFGSKERRDNRGWGRLHCEELYGLYFAPYIIRAIKSRRMRWAGHVTGVEERRGANWVLVGKREGKRPLGTRRRKWEDNIKMDLKKVGFGTHGLDKYGSG